MQTNRTYSQAIISRLFFYLIRARRQILFKLLVPTIAGTLSRIGDNENRVLPFSVHTLSEHTACDITMYKIVRTFVNLKLQYRIDGTDDRRK